jgi:hypothetical protein
VAKSCLPMPLAAPVRTIRVGFMGIEKSEYAPK